METIIRIERRSPAWYALLNAMDRSAEVMADVSLSVGVTGRGDTVLAVKVGEGIWSAHQKIVNNPSRKD